MKFKTARIKMPTLKMLVLKPIQNNVLNAYKATYVRVFSSSFSYHYVGWRGMGALLIRLHQDSQVYFVPSKEKIKFDRKRKMPRYKK